MIRLFKQGARLAMLAGTAAVMLSTTAAAAGDLSGREVVMWSPGGKYAEALRTAYIEPFEEATGAKVRLVEAGLDEAAAATKAQLNAGKLEWDAWSGLDAPLLPRFIKEGLFQEVDASKIAGAEKLPDDAVHPFGVAVLNSAVTVSYRDVDGVTPLTSVKDFFDPSIKGPRAAGGTAGDAPLMCILALAADSVTMEEMTNGLDLDRCGRIWDGIKDQVTSWWTTGSEMAQWQIDEEVDYCMCWDGRIIQAALANPKWRVQHNGGIQFFTYLAYLKGTQNEDVLNAFASYMLDARQQAEFTRIVGYSAPNPESVGYLPAAYKSLISVTPEAQEGLLTVPDALNEALSGQSEKIGEWWLEYISQ
ncbi:ABC transporter substrate-binding protein [Pelagibius sp.]|uniref:ABC transporter substrate-binding protein n=1 Tax=Pelagibius sp. TaxID=1931238 RepID=UPI003BB02237